MSVSKIVAAAASSAGGAGLDVDEVFSTTLYSGTNANQTITNGIDLSGEGGLVWTKARDYGVGHGLVDTVRGNTKYLEANGADAEATTSVGITAFNSTGYNLGADDTWKFNVSNSYVSEYVSWTFRKAPKFFDVVVANSISGSGNTISHSLGCDVGMIIAKKTSGTENWYVWHRGINTGSMYLNGTNATGGITTEYVFGNGSSVVQPTSTQFTFGAPTSGDYVFYLFAHHANDGSETGFGPNGDSPCISCGSYSGNTSTRPTINLGFEPQFLMIKRTDSADNWYMLDTMRGILTSGGNDTYLYANTSGAEATVSEVLKVTATGFELEDDFGGWNASGGNYIYMAIRRGPLAAPDDATKVFAIDAGTTINNLITTGFNVDMALTKGRNGTSGYLGSRLTGDAKFLQPNATDADSDYDGFSFDISNGFKQNQISANNITWMWKRAPSYFDCVGFLGTGSAGLAVNHNLGVVPEMIWVKSRSHGGTFYDWAVYHKDLGNTKYLFLNTDAAAAANDEYWNDTSPTSSVFSLGGPSTRTNESGKTYIAYLFATVAGVSKVGSYTGNATDNHVIDCGFSGGARFVLIKKSSAPGEWFVVDTVRGIVSGADPFLELNQSRGEIGNDDIIDPSSSGFALSSRADCNANGRTYIFYAIA